MSNECLHSRRTGRYARQLGLESNLFLALGRGDKTI